MKRLIVGVICAVMIVTNVFADGETMSAEQREKIVRDLINNGQYDAAKRVMNQAALEATAKLKENQMVEANKVPVEQRVFNNAKQWTELGTNVGVAMVAAAKELGIAAAQFAETPLGKVTTAVIVYKIVGKDVASNLKDFARFVFSVIIFFVGVAMLPAIYRMCAYKQIKYEYYPVFWGMFQRRRVSEASIRSDDGAAAGYFGCIGAMLAIAFMTWLLFPVVPV